MIRRTYVTGELSSHAEADPIASLYERQFRSFLAGAYAVVGDVEEARDVVQEAFARALRQRRQYRGRGTLEAWVWRIVLNAAHDVARRSRVAELSADELAALLPLVAESASSKDLAAELRGLPERQRLAVFFHYYADLPYEEVARLLNITPGTVGASLNAAREKLRHRIKEAYE